ncbi:hypothetical protein Patl1_22525 [Pistacia atlantica]|uniref:Uncharacterized protein n=1 Tax=Pistacia atlantica TaxID=434234 RepID=A0ACC0ZUH5_9ROSI|nr:hypothetical protein Patl1_22525 [Pistacia atlantica]
MGREGIQNIQLVEGNSSNLQANFTDQGSRKSAVPVPNYEYQMVPLDLSASEDVSIWSTLWRVVKGYLSWVLFKWSTPTFVFHRICCLRGNIMFMLSITWRRVTESINWRLALVFISFCSVRDIDWHDHREMFSLFLFQFSVLLSRYAFVFEPKIEILISGAVLRLLCYTLIVTELLFEKKPSSEPSKPNHLRVQIDEDHHESFQSDFCRLPDDLASPFDLGYQNKELTYSSFVFTMQRVDEDKDGRLPGNKCSVMGVYDKYNLSFLPVAFAFYHVFSAVSAFRKEHENGIYNAAEPPAENQVNQHDGSRNIMVHMTVTGKPLNMVIDLTMVTCYEQLFRKLRDEMSLAEKVLWGDRPRWDVLYLDISNAAHYLREDEITWG